MLEIVFGSVEKDDPFLAHFQRILKIRTGMPTGMPVSIHAGIKKETPFQLSQAPVKEYDSGYGSGGFVGAWSAEIYRSAQYAELACLCMRMKMEYGNNESFVSGPYNGSLQGAIIAWNFMYNQLNSSRHYNKALSNGYYEELKELTK